MVSRYLEIFREKEEASYFLESCSFPLKKTIRYNSLRVSKSTFEKIMKEKRFQLKMIEDVEIGYEVIRSPSKPSLGASLEYLKGFYHIQSKSSMIPPLLLSPSVKDSILDMAAAPGSKTSEIAQLLGNGGSIVALEKSRRRVKSLLSNINRLGVLNTIIVRTDAINLTKTPLRFDEILLDAPCSGEGIIYKDQSRRNKTSPTDLKSLALNQLKLVKAAYDLLDSGGRMVYSTCSIGPEEGEFVVNYAVSELDMKVVKSSKFSFSSGITDFNNVKFDESVSSCIRIYPHLHGSEGFFICLLKKD
ncbi:NOL1/NOP2/sun family putative RNA methylase [Sulfuracidifex tepidarius]|nr:RsmB/NOP family class I SAM-dependent RNA methyltransferase [Sulfuracidifex tepidarius]